jgi:hypothetical protein
MSHITLTFPDGNQRDYSAGVTPLEVAASIAPGLAKKAISATVNGQHFDLQWPIPANASIAIHTMADDVPALELIRHDCAHIMAEAIGRIFPGVQLVYGPPLAWRLRAARSPTRPARKSRPGRVTRRVAAFSTTDALGNPAGRLFTQEQPPPEPELAHAASKESARARADGRVRLSIAVEDRGCDAGVQRSGGSLEKLWSGSRRGSRQFAAKC